MDDFMVFSLKMFNDLNENISESFGNLKSNSIEKSLNKILQQEENFKEIDSLTDKLVNKIIYLQQSRIIEKNLKN